MNRLKNRIIEQDTLIKKYFYSLHRMGVESNNQGNQLLYLPDGGLPIDYPEVYEELLSCVASG